MSGYLRHDGVSVQRNGQSDHNGREREANLEGIFLQAATKMVIRNKSTQDRRHSGQLGPFPGKASSRGVEGLRQGENLIK